jgi:MazG family protein
LLKVKPELSTLAEAQKLGKVAATVGFDWPDIQGVWHKVCEELDELQAELPNNRANASNQRMSDELGDLLFALVNLARHLKVNAEEALHAANLRFRKRFAYIEQQLQLQNRSLADTPLEQLEALWQEAKTQP